MKIFRNKRDKKLYTIAYVKPRMILGSWYEAKPYLHQGKMKKIGNFDLFVVVSER